MDNEHIIYQQKVWEFLDNMAPDDCYLVEKLCIPENKNKFVTCVKSYMDTKIPFQGYINFNHNYSRIYKTNEITFKPDERISVASLPDSQANIKNASK